MSVYTELGVAIDEPVDVVFRVEGDVIRYHYEYHLHSAIKQVVPDLMEQPDVWFGRLENIKVGRIGGAKYAQMRGDTTYRIRCNPKAARHALPLSGHEMRVATHLLRFGDVTFSVPAPSRNMWCEMVILRPRAGGKLSDKERNHPPRREFDGALYGWLEKSFGVDTDRAKVTVGRKRRLYVGKHWAGTGYAVGIEGLTDEQSKQLLREGIGGRRNMGGGLFLPGKLPKWAR